MLRTEQEPPPDPAPGANPAADLATQMTGDHANIGNAPKPRRYWTEYRQVGADTP